MRVLWTYGSRRDVEPMVGLAVQLRTLGAEVRAAGLRGAAGPCWCAAGAGRPAGAPDCARGDAAGGGLPRRAAELVAAQFDTVAAMAERCDALVATGVIGAVRP